MTAIDSAALSRRRLFGGLPVTIVISLFWLVMGVMVYKMILSLMVL